MSTLQETSENLLSFCGDKRYSTIYADPPWRFQNRTGKVAPENKKLTRYETMSLEDIMALPVEQVAAAKSHLYLWVPNALLPDGLAVMKAWGFEYKGNIIWEKVLPSGFLNAKRQPLREHEDIMIFYNKQPTYNPQMTEGKPCHSKGKAVGKANDEILNNSNYGNFTVVQTTGNMKYPTSIWKFSKPHPSIALHPTQKPIELCRYAIRTYTNEGDLVVDFCCGSGSILKAAQLENRNYIGIDNGICDRKGEFENWFWADVAKYRLENMDK